MDCKRRSEGSLTFLLISMMLMILALYFIAGFCMIHEEDFAIQPPVVYPIPSRPEGFFGSSVAIYHLGDDTDMLFVGPDEDGGVRTYKYFPGLYRMERLDDTIASICPALPHR